jgi:hypothetical protein
MPTNKTHKRNFIAEKTLAAAATALGFKGEAI